MLSDPIGTSCDGRPVRLADVWPTGAEFDEAVARAREPGDYRAAFTLTSKSAAWTALDAPSSQLFSWDQASTCIRPPPFAAFAERPAHEHWLAHPLLVLGDAITTDHISPAGQIPPDSEAGTHLIERQERPRNLNVYAARRGNCQVMLRGGSAKTSAIQRCSSRTQTVIASCWQALIQLKPRLRLTAVDRPLAP